MVVLIAANYKVCCENVKSELLSCEYNIWRPICEGCGKDPIAKEFLQQDAQALCIIYKNLHDDDIKRILGLKHAKEMWDKIESIFGDGTNNKKEFEKKINKNKSQKKNLQKQEYQPQESHSSSAHDLANDEKRS